jgi:hypothetical protein
MIIHTTRLIAPAHLGIHLLHPLIPTLVQEFLTSKSPEVLLLAS